MSIKYFHLVFITFSILCAIFMGVWAQNQNLLLVSIISFLTALLMLIYEFFFIKKMKLLILLPLFLIGLSNAATACSVCFGGNANDPTIKGVQAGIYVLLGILVLIFTCFIIFFRNFSKRTKTQ